MRFLSKLVGLASISLVALAANATTYELPANGSDVIGEVQHIKTEYSDTFVAIAHEHDLAFTMLKYANPKVDAWLPGEGTRIKLPTQYVLPDVPREGIVINQAEMRLYYYPPADSKNAGKVITVPIGAGRKGWHTPLGKTQVTEKNPNPTWNVPKSIWLEHKKRGDPIPHVVPPGPDNPLGDYAMRLGIPGYLIHGTNDWRGIGMQVSHGCIRLYPKDIEHLFSLVEVGTPVRIINQPYKAGWNGEQIVLEANPPLNTKQSEQDEFPSWTKVLVQASAQHPDARINWKRAREIVQEANGIPQPVSGLKRQNGTDRSRATQQASNQTPPSNAAQHAQHADHAGPGKKTSVAMSTQASAANYGRASGANADAARYLSN